ncbi:RNA-directed DNA polymerase, eukaryota, reverse transcriptase zinc-binding domain protein [Tanacetum coccineum]
MVRLFISGLFSTLKHDIVSYVKEFEVSTLIPRGCNSSYIALIPKVDDPLVVGDFRPISLIGSQYKIIAKILANCLSRVVSSVVGDVQMAYIKEHQIIDGPLMVEEIIAWVKKYKKRVMFLKLDFEKAFDSLSWSFLFSVLEQMGFSSKWRAWIHSYLDSAFASVLVNGSPTKEFKIQRGIRQGDPLSPFLFILAFEALNVALPKATNKNIFRGIKWSRDNAKNLSRILTCFYLASGLKVNLNKSKLFGIGLPIGANMSRCFNWNPLVERFHKRLSKWKSKALSIGGSLTLIKSVLGSLGVYYFSTFKAPKKPSSFRHPDCLVCDRNPITRTSLSALATTSYVTHHFVQPTDNWSMSPYLPPGLTFQWVWRREPRPGPETEELVSLVSLLSNLYLSDVEDRWECTIDASRRFSVKGMRSFITSVSFDILYCNSLECH